MFEFLRDWLRPGTSSGALRVTLEPDGFWIRADWPAGTPLTVTYDQGGQSFQRDETYVPSPRGLFVTTGGRATNVVVTARTTAAAAGSAPDTDRPPAPSDPVISPARGPAREPSAAAAAPPARTPDPDPVVVLPSRVEPSAY